MSGNRKSGDRGTGNQDEERKIRLRPRRPRKTGQSEPVVWSVAMRTILRYAKSSGRRISGSKTGTAVGRAGRRQFNQRCAVRVTYAKNRQPGLWKAHARYIGRESATREPSSAGFDATSESLDVTSRLDDWQNAGDQQLWKFIVSPEFGEYIDLQRLTRRVLEDIEKDLSNKLEWIAVAHFNTEHPHVHVALRGVCDNGLPLKLPRDYVKTRIRQIAEDACTAQLGYRTELDAKAAAEREVDQRRFTALDRSIRSASVQAERDSFSGYFTVSMKTPESPPRTAAGSSIQLLTTRLAVLRQMGLAESPALHIWRVRDDFDTVLKVMQRTSDRQRMLAAHGALLSDERLQFVVTDARKVDQLAGRVLLHGEEEDGRHAGKHYMLLEGTEGAVHMIFYNSEMEDARSRGRMRVNSFVQMTKKYEAGAPELEVKDFGDSEAVLKNKRCLRAIAEAQVGNGAYPREGGWGGWLGRYQAALAQAASEIFRSTDLSRDR